MITKADLDAAIAECVGEREPNANTCIKLAAFYTIRSQMFPDVEEMSRDVPTYSYAADPGVKINSDSEFAQAVEGLPQDKVWSVIDELMAAVMVAEPALYRAVFRRLREIK